MAAPPVVAATTAAPVALFSPADYAAWPVRAASLLIDQLVWIGLPVVTFAVIHTLRWTDEKGDPAGIGMVLWAAALAAGVGLGLWNRIYRDGTTGQSVGRQVTGTRLVALATGRPMGMLMVMARQIAHLVDNLPCICAPIGFLWPLWDDKRQTFADKIVGTVVVRESAVREIV
jgi:uncharacterized RDD family membrane protein YckC